MLRSTLTVLGVALVAGCSSDGLNPPQLVQEDALFWALDLNHHAVLMSNHAPYDTLTLHGAARNIRGEVLAGVPQPTYVSRDLEHVIVTPEGVLRALAPTTGTVSVMATLTIGNVRHIDSILVKVDDEPSPPVLATFSIHPVPPDSAKAGMGSIACFAVPGLTPPSFCARQIPVQVADASGAPILGAPVAFRSSDPNVASVGPGGSRNQVSGYHVGSVMFDASTTVFGVSKADTVAFRIGWPVAGSLNLYEGGNTFPELTVGTGAVVAFGASRNAGQFVDTIPSEVVFTDPSDVAEITSDAASFFPSYFYYCTYLHLCAGAGNMVLDTSNLGVGVRRFPVPSTYEYHVSRLGFSNGVAFTGRIIVVDEREP